MGGSIDAVNELVALTGRDAEEFAWRRAVFERGATSWLTSEWSTASRATGELLALGEVLIESWSGNGERLEAIVDMNGVLVAVVLRMRSQLVRVMVAALPDRKAEASAAVERVRGLFPPREPRDELMVVFWFEGDRPDRARRTIEAPRWDAIASNYPAETRHALERLMRDFRPSARGQLLLWHGEPGTGKTWALRALGRAWHDWCDVEYVTDPDNFFGSADYLLHVLLEGDGRALPIGQEARPDRWRLLVLEDTGELLAADAKSQEGQRLSRLLNVVDGFIGQGLKIMLLVTTNEELRALHPAVARPGRCASVVEFTAFPAGAAADWLRDRGRVLSGSPRSLTLAELYALADGEAMRARSGPLGFAP